MQTTYNSNYYQTNKIKLRERAKLREQKKSSDAKKYHVRKKKFSFSFEYVEPLILVALITVFTFLLLREVSAFYAEDGSSNLISWLKAIALEGSVLVFSFISPPKVLHRVVYKGFAILICVYSVVVMAQKQIGSGLMTIETSKTISSAILDAKNDILEKSKLREYYLSHDWISAARKIEIQIDSLRGELKELTSESKKLKPINATSYSTAAQVAFRIILAIANILASSYFGKLLRTFKPKNGISKQKLEIPKPKIEVSRPKLEISMTPKLAVVADKEQSNVLPLRLKTIKVITTEKKSKTPQPLEFQRVEFDH